MNAENPKIYHEDNLYILGKWFARERHLRGYSMRGLSRASNMTASLISDIENQKIRPNLETIRQLYGELDIDFILDENYLTTMQENILNIYYAIYDQNLDTIDNFFASLKQQIKQLRYSPIAIDVLIIEALVPTLIDDYQVPKAFYALKNHLSYLSTAQKERYFISLGYQQMLKKDYEKALDSFQQAISFHREGRGFAVAHELISRIYSKLFDPFKAIEYGVKASRFHAKWSNIARKIDTDFIQIKSYLELNQTHQAESLIRNLSYLIVESNQRQWFELKSFEVYFYYKLENYEKCLKLIETIPQRNIFLELLHLQVNLNIGRDQESQIIFENLTGQYPQSTHPLEHAMTQLLFYPYEKKITAAIDDACRYLIKHIKHIEEYDAIKDLVTVGLKYAVAKNDDECIEEWVKLSQKLIKFQKI